MKKKLGFTLIELLVVIAIIAILSIIIIPSVINVNKNVNNRLLDQKMEHIETGANLYASKNDDIFNGVDEVEVFVYELIDMGYVSIDVDTRDNRCNAEASHGAKGCVLDPTSSGSLNNDYVIIRKQGAGYTTEYVHNPTGDPSTVTTSDKTLVEAVCEGFASGSLNGKASNGKKCYCYDSAGNKAGKNAVSIKDENGGAINSCIISGENPNNYLRYGDSKPNWRVLGVYNIGGTLTAKMITSEPI